MQFDLYKKRAFEDVRITIYITLIVNGLFIQYIAPFHYLCDYNNYSCVLCGMRYAIDSILDGNFTEAYQSNKLIVLVIFLLAIFLFDTLKIIFNRRKDK